MSNQSLREAGQQALECKRLAYDYAAACAGCDPEEFAAKERDEMYAAIDKLARLARPAEHGAVALLEAAASWIDHAPHGDNCFVSDHYEGDPGNRCNCGKDSLLSAIEADRIARGGAA